MTNYCVYYRVDPARIGALKSEIEKLFGKIQKEFGIRGRWMHRRDEPLTCMEVYEEVKDEAAFEAVLEREAATLGLERKVERFVCA